MSDSPTSGGFAHHVVTRVGQEGRDEADQPHTTTQVR